VNVDMFAKQIEIIHWRLAELYRDASSSVQLQPELLLPSAFKELGTASEELGVAVEELFRQTEELAATRWQVEAERKRYQDLFEFMPHAYLVSDGQGKILEANRAAAMLLNVEQSSLVGKLLISFIPVQARPAFRSKFNQLQQQDWIKEWVIPLQPRKHEPMNVTLSVAAVRDNEGRLVNLRYIVREFAESQFAQKSLSSNDYNLYQNYSKHVYARGEIIPLQPTSIWLVSQGLVKLSTMNETGEEVLIGLAGPSMPFGSGMTSLSIYQATALSKDVQLVCIPRSEIATSPHLSQTLLPKMNDRLRQTESLLAISGQRRVQDRLYHLLLLLKQEIGQPIAQGTRLKVRLTHQDLADACCTTRVTITRLLGRLQKQGKIKFDSQHHMILSNFT
jgi:PAS domain S-box-containing protein